MIEDEELAKLFKAESAEHLARLDDGLLHLEKTPTDQAILEEVFRESHSLKGAARMLGLSKIETASHGLETILNTARKGETPLTPDIIEQMTVVLGELRKLVTVECGSEIVEYGMGKTLPTQTSVSSISQSESPDSTDSTPRNQHSAFDSFHIQTVRVETRKLDDLLTLVGELSVIEGRAQHRQLLMDSLQEQSAMLERSRRKFQLMLRGAETESKTREALRQMLHTDTEVLEQLGAHLKVARNAFYEDSEHLQLTVNTLKERVYAARLLPLSTVFDLFPRMVRDLAKQHHKEVEMEIEGGEISVDKRILEEMKDPLMHLLRNAIDHGIEPPAERKRQGKTHSGKIRLRAAQENSSILLEVRDDGHGLDVAAIRQTASQRGLYDDAMLDAMTPAQLKHLILLPGFSTRSSVTELSGRGVGLDVVRVNVERMKGSIRIESVLHQDTVMQMRLPLSLSTTRLLLVRVGAHLYGLPIEFVHTSLRVQVDDIFPLEGRTAIKLHGLSLIAPRLADLLALPDSPHPTKGEERGSGLTVCIVIQVGDERLGLRVDELLDEEEVVAKPLGAPLIRIRNVSSLAILGSGEICAVLNPADLMRSAKTSTKFEMHPQGVGRAVPVAEATTATLRSEDSIPDPAISAQSTHCILLVEDSALVRAMEKRILVDAGYEVVVAVDGVNALNELGSRSFSAVVSDVNMPNMDGLTLTTRIRQQPRYKNLPVILVTSLASDEDKQRGLEAGANAYIAKPSFDQRVLLETLKRLI
jgi:two-component system chemotaxis sensor kinase CheA